LQAANGQQLRDRGGRKALQASTFAQRQLCKIREQVRLGVALDNATSGVFVRFEVLGFAGVAVRWVEALQSVSGKGEAAALDLLQGETGAQMGFVSVTAASDSRLRLNRRPGLDERGRSRLCERPLRLSGGAPTTPVPGRTRVARPCKNAAATSVAPGIIAGRCPRPRLSSRSVPESAVCLDRATSSAARLKVIGRTRGAGAPALVRVGAASSTEGGGRA
jgi:hypothetical protein